jgi:hypothetical protein
MESKSDACNMAREYGATCTRCSRTDERIRLRSRSIMPAQSQQGNDSSNTVVGRGESGWCSDVTSTHGAWRHAGVRFLLPGVSFVSSVGTHTSGEEEGLRDGQYSLANLEETRCSEEVAQSQSLHFLKAVPSEVTSTISGSRSLVHNSRERMRSHVGDNGDAHF